MIPVVANMHKLDDISAARTIDEEESSPAPPKSQGDAPDAMHRLRVAVNGLSLLDDTTMRHHKLRRHRRQSRHGQIHGATPSSRLRGRHQRQPAACVPPHPICPCTKEAPRSSAGPREPTLEVGMCGCGNSLSSALQRLQPVMPTALGRGRVTYTLQQASHLPDQRRRRKNHLHCFKLPAVQSHTPPIMPQERIPAAASSRAAKPDGAGRRQRRGAGAHRGGPWKTGSYRLPCRPHGRAELSRPLVIYLEY